MYKNNSGLALENRFVSKDPSGLGGGVNIYTYAVNDPVNLSDPSGLFTIIINDPGSRGGGSSYGGTVTVIPDNGPIVSVPGSSWPNPSNANPGVAPGSYSATYSNTGHHGSSPGVNLNGGGYIPTIGPNPNQGGQSTANGVQVHCGDSPSNRGSAGCMTVQPGSCGSAFGSLGEGETGSVIVIRGQ